MIKKIVKFSVDLVYDDIGDDLSVLGKFYNRNLNTEFRELFFLHLSFLIFKED